MSIAIIYLIIPKFWLSFFYCNYSNNYLNKKEKKVWFLCFLNSVFFFFIYEMLFMKIFSMKKKYKIFSNNIIINSTLLFKKIFSTNIGYFIRKCFFNVKQKKINYTNIPQEKFAHYFSIYSIHILIIYCTSEDSFLKKKNQQIKQIYINSPIFIL